MKVKYKECIINALLSNMPNNRAFGERNLNSINLLKLAFTIFSMLLNDLETSDLSACTLEKRNNNKFLFHLP